MTQRPPELAPWEVDLYARSVVPGAQLRWLDREHYEWIGPGAAPTNAQIVAAWQADMDDRAARAAATAAAEAQDATDRATLAAFDTAMANYIALANPTAAQTANAVQAQARAWRYVVRRLSRLGYL